MGETWTTMRTEQRMHDGEVLPAMDVVALAKDGSLGGIVARVHAIGEGRLEEVQRRAKLLAAAPDLLEAALDAEDFLFNLPGESEERSQLMLKLRAAISKAGAKVADTSQATWEGR